MSMIITLPAAGRSGAFRSASGDPTIGAQRGRTAAAPTASGRRDAGGPVHVQRAGDERLWVLLFRIEARQQRVERIGLDEFAAPRGLHRVDGLVIRYQRLDGFVQRMLL